MLAATEALITGQGLAGSGPTENRREIMQDIEQGDKVYHRGLGEEWIVMRSGVDSSGPFVEPAGWPPCRARADDCDLIEKGAGLHLFAPTEGDPQ